VDKTEKFSLHFFICAPPKFFSIKETKIFLFCLSANAGIAETPPPHSPPAWAEFIPYNPEGICAGPQIFFGGGKILKQKGWWVGLER